MIYFDHNASTPLDERVLQEMLPFFGQLYGNPSSLHRLGRIAHSAIEVARERVARLVNARAENIIFTSGGTEANNLALNSVSSTDTVMTSVIEHASVLEPCLASFPHPQLMGVTPSGYLNASCLTEAETLVQFASLMWVNNETGVIQDIAHLTQTLKSQGALVHTDAVQAAGKIAVDFQASGVDFMSLSSHKIYGPKGCGALVCKNPEQVTPLLYGGGQESGGRAGTENVAAIVGFGKAAELAQLELSARQQHTQTLKEQLETALKRIEGLHIFAQTSKRISNTTQFGVQGCVGEMLLMQLEKKGIAVSSGSACTSEETRISHVLSAMQIAPDIAQSAIRVSLGQQNTAQEIDFFVHTLQQIIANNR